MKKRGKTISYAFKKSLPVLFGYLFLGSAFGIMLYDIGYNWVWAIFISLFVYAGSGQFLLVSLLANGASLPTVALMTFFINSRHMFYGLSFIEKFKKGGWKYPFMIFSLTDETYSVNLTFDNTPNDVDDASARFLLGLFDHIYWITGSVIGALAGQLIPLDFTGIDFSMTALFVIIFVELILDMKDRLKIVGPIGIITGIICLMIFGADNFILPTLIVIVAILSVSRPYFDKTKEVQ